MNGCSDSESRTIRSFSFIASISRKYEHSFLASDACPTSGAVFQQIFPGILWLVSEHDDETSCLPVLFVVATTSQTKSFHHLLSCSTIVVVSAQLYRGPRASRYFDKAIYFSRALEGHISAELFYNRWSSINDVIRLLSKVLLGHLRPHLFPRNNSLPFNYIHLQYSVESLEYASFPKSWTTRAATACRPGAHRQRSHSIRVDVSNVEIHALLLSCNFDTHIVVYNHREEQDEDRAKVDIQYSRTHWHTHAHTRRDEEDTSWSALTSIHRRRYFSQQKIEEKREREETRFLHWDDKYRRRPITTS